MRDNTMNVLVNFVNEYEIDNGTRGVSVQYMFLDDNDSLPVSINLVGASGSRCAKVSLPFESRQKFKEVPAIYKGSFEMSVGADGKPILKLVDADFVGSISVKADAKASAK